MRNLVTPTIVATLVSVLSACGADSSTIVEPPPGEVVPEFGEATNRKFTHIAGASDGLHIPRDLKFDPAKPVELWTVNLAFEGTVTFYDPGASAQKAIVRVDPHRTHFMSQPLAIAMGAPGTFATCGESGQTFMGPVLWPIDTAVYAHSNITHGGGELGSHIDMLHETPKCLGITHETENVYWVSDGTSGNIVRYDFGQDHGPGHDDHTDGVIRRYTEATVSRVPYVAGHIALDKQTGWLYFTDPGGKRIRRLLVSSGHIHGPITPMAEQIAEYSEVRGATVENVVTSGLTLPSGLALHNGRIFVSDHATNEIIAYDVAGSELQRVKTPAAGIMGITVGPDGKIWYVDSKANTVIRVDPE